MAGQAQGISPGPGKLLGGWRRPRAQPGHHRSIPWCWCRAGGDALVPLEGGGRGISHLGLGARSYFLLFVCKSPQKDMLVNI